MALIVCIGYLGLSAPDKVVIDKKGEINGTANVLRELLQGQRFWKDQLNIAKVELAWERETPNREAMFKEDMRRLDAEFAFQMREFYRDFPEMRPSQAELQAESLRQRADVIESQQFERELAVMSRQRASELEHIEKYLVTRIN